MVQNNSVGLALIKGESPARRRVCLVTEYPATAVPGEALRLLARLVNQKTGRALHMLVASEARLAPKELNSE